MCCNQFSQAAVSIKISNLHICFCSFDLSYLILEENNFIYKNVYCIVLSCQIVFCFNLFCFDLVLGVLIQLENRSN